ncbi:DNA glycosylase [Coemansia spiralis]|nr:DNA glycosylase [Coemansia spiralis]
MTVTKKEQPDIEPSWIDLNVKPSELQLDRTLMCGQAFRWKSTGEQEWTCALWDHVIDLKQTPETVLCRSLGHLPSANIAAHCPDSIVSALSDYFQLKESLESHCDRWAAIDPDFASLRKTQLGVRALRQPVVENLLTFIASSNNNIKRITMLIDKLSTRYGRPIDTLKGRFYTFPRVQDIAKDISIEDTLIKLGFGYRAKYYDKTIKLLAEHQDPEQFLLGLRSQPWAHAKAQLMQFSGVGPKVADCVCLMSLDKINAVPIDTHIWQIAQKRYSLALLARQLASAKKPTMATYEAAQQLLLQLFSPHAGWAQLLLFTKDLPHLNDSKPAKQTKRKTEATVVARTVAVTVKSTMTLRSTRRKAK